MSGARGAWRTLLLAAVVSAGALSTTLSVAGACDACLEDKVAATYDWRVIVATKQQGHTVVFGAISGSVAPGDEALKARLLRQLSSVAGVDARSVRVSLAPAAVSFSCDPRRTSTAALLAAMNQRIRGSGLRLVLLRIGAPGSAGPAVSAASVKALHGARRRSPSRGGVR